MDSQARWMGGEEVGSSVYPELPSSSPPGVSPTPVDAVFSTRRGPYTPPNPFSSPVDSVAGSPDLDPETLNLLRGADGFQYPDQLQYTQNLSFGANLIDPDLFELNHDESPTGVAGPYMAPINIEQSDAFVLPAECSGEIENPYGLSIRNEVEFRQQLAQRFSVHNQGCSDFPADSATQQIYVKRLFDAIKNVNNTDDSGRVVTSFQNTNYQDEYIEMTCWEVLFKAKESQESGRQCAAHAESKYEQYPTFQARMEAIIENCKHSKLLCKSMLAPDFICRVVDQPQFEVERKASNKVLNNIKSRQNQAGQSAMKKGLVDNTGRWVDDDDNESNDAAVKSEISTPARGAPYGTPSSLATTGRKRSRQQSEVGEGHEVAATPSKRRINRRKPKSSVQSNQAVSDANDFGFVPLPALVDFQTSNRQSVITDPIPGFHLSDALPTAQFDGAGVDEAVDLNDNVVGPAQPSNLTTPDSKNEKALHLLEERYKSALAGLLRIPRELAAKTELFHLRWYAHCNNPKFKERYWHSTELPPGYFGWNTRVYAESGAIAGHVGQFIKGVSDLALARGDLQPDGSFDIANNNFIELDITGTFESYNRKLQILGIIRNPFGTIDENNIAPLHKSTQEKATA